MARNVSSSGTSLFVWLGIALIVIVLDQFTKTLITGEFRLGDSRMLTSWFNLVRAHNLGAAFNFLSNAAGWQRWFFIALGLGASVFMVWMLRRYSTQRLFCFALACILGGAVGNVVDRMMHGYVVDFLDFHWDFLAPLFPGGHFPSFNLADSSITLGAICLVFDEIRRVRRGG